MSKQLIVWLVVSGSLVLGFGPSTATSLDANSPAAAGEMAFDLKEVSVLDLDESIGRDRDVAGRFMIGCRGVCQDKPLAEVFYPRLKSKRPLYGSIRLGGQPGINDSGIEYVFVIDEFRGPGKGYDRLYFDTNHDRDLSNETPTAGLKDPPKRAVSLFTDDKQQVCFETLDVPVPLDRDTTRPMKFLPRLAGLPNNYPNLALVTLQVHTGKITIAGESFAVSLGHNHIVTGWFDEPYTALHLVPDKGRQSGWWGADRLMGIHKIAGTFYRFSCTPAGDRLMVRPVAGPFGTLKAGAGGRKVNPSEITLQGSLRSKDIAVAIGEVGENGYPAATGSWQLPPGDYLPELLNAHLGSLDIEMSENYHSDGKPQDRDKRPFVYGIQIRPDRPFAFDFSDKPDVMFASPAKDLVVKRGDEVNVKAVLIDPNLDIMIRGLRSGNKAIVPFVAVTRQGGEIVGQGPMPFG
jgi:hypothetical protein